MTSAPMASDKSFQQKKRVSLDAPVTILDHPDEEEKQQASLPHLPRQMSSRASSIHEFSLISPFQDKLENRHYKKVFPNRVYTPWYRRYFAKLPPAEDRLDFQPCGEVQRVDEDIALQYFYGEDGLSRDPIDKFELERRKAALVSYNKIREQEEKLKAKERDEHELAKNKTKFDRLSGKRRSVYGGMELEFGATEEEKNVYIPIVSFLHKLHLAKQRMLRRFAVKPNSWWKVLTNVIVLRKLKAMYNRYIQMEIHARFRKVIRLVVAVMRFIDTIRVISGDTKQLLKDVDNFIAVQTKESAKSGVMGKKKVFVAQKYYLFRELNLPFETMLTLTKPWFTRTAKEVEEVVNTLQVYKSFVQYPPLFQRRLATLAWYIEAGPDKYIIRERHLACDFYILLTGRAKIVKLSGDPYVHGDGEIQFVRYLRKSEGFGDESMSDPECERDYSVISTEPCILLSISVHDYLQMLSKRKEHEFAPEHIIFLSTLKFMEKFPKIKLLEEGDDNITVHYFRQDTVIAKNLKDSKYVFVILNGTCRQLCEMVPDISTREVKKTGEALPKKRKRQIFQAENPFAAIIKQDFNIDMSGLPRNLLMKKLETTKRMMEPMLLHNCSSIADYQQKSDHMLRSLPPLQRKILVGERKSRLSLVASSVTMFLEKAKQYREELECKASSSRPRSNSFLDYIADTTSVLPPDLQSNPDIKFLKQEGRYSRALEEGSTKSDFSRKVSAQRSSIPESIVTEQDESVQESRVPMTEGSVHESEKSSSEESGGNSRSTARRHNYYQRYSRAQPPHLFSRWKFVRQLHRGDYVGHEWLNYNDGPFDPPEEITCLVSDGCEIIMVKKVFLLKYLRKDE